MFIKEFSGKELHEFLSEGLKKFGVEFEDAKLYDSKEAYIVALGDMDVEFEIMDQQKYVSLENYYGEPIYYYPL